VSETRLVWHDAFRFTGTDSWGNEVAIDATEGSGSGAKPADLLPLALAACTAYDVVNILRKQRQDLAGLEAVITSTQEADAPWTFTDVTVRYIARGSVDETKARKALALSEEKYCSVSATLRPAVRMTFTIEVAPG
jgi:putative redox protein